MCITLYFEGGGTFIDAGANVGSYTLNLFGRVDHVIAIEACLANADLIRHTCEKNNISNVEVVQRALYKEDNEKIDLYISGDTCGNHSLYEGRGEKETVLTTTIDTICLERKLTDVRLIKIDIEGSEYNCLQGAVETIKVNRPVILCEFNQRAAQVAGYDLFALYCFFNEYAYHAFVLDEYTQQLVPFDDQQLSEATFANNLFLFPENECKS